MFCSRPAAKQEAFEESIRLRNQFRSLDEDEVEFLDSVLESTRRKEQEVKKETSEMLEIFRKQQEEADKAALLEEGDRKPADGGGAGSPTLGAGEGEDWAVAGKKRKKGPGREKEGVIRGVKIRRKSAPSQDDPALDGGSGAVEEAKQADVDGLKPSSLPASTSASPAPVKPSIAGEESQSDAISQSTAATKPPSKGILGLDYDSDSDD